MFVIFAMFMGFTTLTIHTGVTLAQQSPEKNHVNATTVVKVAENKMPTLNSPVR